MAWQRRNAVLVSCILLGCGLVGHARAQAFVDRALEAGFPLVSTVNGVAVADYDLDGDLDVYVANALRHDPADSTTWNRLYQNDGTGNFVDVTHSAGVLGATDESFPYQALGNRYGAAWADYDNDGDPDLLLTRVGREVLFRNDGDGTFSDVTESSGINDGVEEPDSTVTAAATWWDFDRDGDLDVYLSNWTGRNRFHVNVGGGRFEERGVELGVADTSRTWTALPLDINEDGWLDLYLANDFGPNRLFLADGSGGFIDETFTYRLGDEGNGMGIATGDFNGDHKLDLYVTNIASMPFPNVLYVSSPAGPYEEVAGFLGVEDAGWAWGTEFFDYDQDGDLDLYAVNGFVFEDNTPNKFWQNDLVPTGQVRFRDLTEASGAGDTAEARALVTFDADGDGDQDMLVGTWGDRLRLYENRAATGNWIQMELRGVESNRFGVGALVILETSFGTQVRQHDGIDLFAQSRKPLHFGLGTGTAERARVRWPSGLEEVYELGIVNERVLLQEGVGVGVDNSELPSVIESGLYPNPFTDSVSFSGLGTAEIRVFDLLGRLIRTLPGGHVSYNLDGLPVGTYIFAAGPDTRILGIKAR